MAHLPDSEAGGDSGYVSGRQWFIYKFDKQQVLTGASSGGWGLI